MIKESIHQEDITIQTIYVPNRNSKYKQTEYRGIKIRGFKTFLLRIDRKTRQKISKDLNDLNNTINKLNLNQIFWKLHPTAECPFFSHAHRPFTKIDHILGA